MDQTNRAQIPLSQLVLPMFIENIIRTSLVSVDQLMLYAYSEKAVAALGVVNQMAFFIQLIFMMVAVGASIPITQYLGAARKKEAEFLSIASLLLAGVFAVLLSAILVLLTPAIIGCFPLEPQVNRYAQDFLLIYSAGSIFLALNITQSGILRSYGHSKDPMFVNVIALVINIVGNALFLFGFFGIPVLGVAGVALSTVISQFVAFWLLSFRLKARDAVHFSLKKALKIPGDYYRQILKIGVPTAGENISYNFGQILISRFIAELGTSALAAYSLVITLSRYVFISGVSIGSGTQVKVGYLVGADRANDAYRRVYKYFFAGLVISVTLVILLNIFKLPILHLFTQNPEVIAMASSVFLVGLALEPCRNLNTIIIPGLKGAGDVKFPVFLGMFMMWIIGVGGAYLFGLVLGWGLVGIWIAMTMDEGLRGLVMLLRWRSGRWKTKRLVTSA